MKIELLKDAVYAAYLERLKKIYCMLKEYLDKADTDTDLEIMLSKDTVGDIQMLISILLDEVKA